MSAPPWRWVCECCYRTASSMVLPPQWKMVWQSAICPICVREATILNLGYANLRGGQWAGRRKDPRVAPINGRWLPVAGGGSPDELLGRIRHHLASRVSLSSRAEDRDAVRDLLMDCRDWIIRAWAEQSAQQTPTQEGRR